MRDKNVRKIYMDSVGLSEIYATGQVAIYLGQFGRSDKVLFK